MSEFLGSLRSVFARSPSEQTVHECRHCGTVVDDSAVACPACDGREIARYEL